MRLSMMKDEYDWLIRTLADDLENNRKFKLENIGGENSKGVVKYSNDNGDEIYNSQTLGKRLNAAISAYNREKAKEKIYNMDPEELKRMVCEALEKAQIDFEIKDGGQIIGLKSLNDL